VAGIFPASDKNGAPPGGNVCNGYSPQNAVIGEGPLYYKNDCTTILTDCAVNAGISEILAAVDYLGVPYNANRVDNLGQAIRDTFQTYDASIDERVLRAGDTMTGTLVLAGDPEAPLEAATKGYVDATAAAAVVPINNAKVDRAGDTMTGPLVLPGDPTLDSQAATKSYVDAHAPQFGDAPHDTFAYGRFEGTWLRVLPLGGGNLGGPLFAYRDPLGPTEVATKNYVDIAMGSGGGGGVDLSAYAPLASPVFTGVPKAPTPVEPADNKQLVTVEFVKALLATANFSTGDAKLTLKTVADPGWVMANDGTIGDATSGATTRANADCEALFILIWTNINNTNAPVTPGGRGTGAKADFDAHKKIGLTKMLGRALAVAGSGLGLTARPLGNVQGAETYTFSGGEHAAHTHGVTDPNHTHFAQGNYNYNITASYVSIEGGSTYNVGLWGGYSQQVTVNASPTGIVLGNQGGNVPFSIVQPTTFLNIMIKL